jgi:hypothetical protein
VRFAAIIHRSNAVPRAQVDTSGVPPRRNPRHVALGRHRQRTPVPACPTFMIAEAAARPPITG